MKSNRYEFIKEDDKKKNHVLIEVGTLMLSIAWLIVVI